MAMRTNDLLLDALRPQFADNDEVDTWGMAQFLYWLGQAEGNAVNENQHWMQRLDEFLQFRRDGGNAEGTIADDKAVVGQWISYALECNVRPDERNDELLRQWVTAIADLAPLTHDNCRAHMNPWWAVEFRRRDESTQRARSPATEPHGLVRRALRAGQMGSQLLRMRLAC